MSSDDQAMSRAIEASLSYSVTEDTYHELSLHEWIRQGDTYVLSDVDIVPFGSSDTRFMPQSRRSSTHPVQCRLCRPHRTRTLLCSTVQARYRGMAAYAFARNGRVHNTDIGHRCVI